MGKNVGRSITGPVVQFLVLLLAAAMAGCADDPKLPKLAADATVLAFGDSLTHGTGAGAGEDYPALLQERIGRRVVNAGVPGETSADGLARLPRALEEHRPALVILCLGGNDFLRRLDPAQTRANLDRMIAMIRASGAALVLVAVPQLRVLGGNDPVYEALARQHRLVLEDEVLDDVLHDRDLKSDPIHPNNLGYRRVAEALADLLEERGAL